MTNLTLKSISERVEKVAGKLGFDLHAANDRIDALEGESVSLHEGVDLAQSTASTALDKANEALVDVAETRAEIETLSNALRQHASDYLEMVKAFEKRVLSSDQRVSGIEGRVGSIDCTLYEISNRNKGLGSQLAVVEKMVSTLSLLLDEERETTKAMARLGAALAVASAFVTAGFGAAIIYLFHHA